MFSCKQRSAQPVSFNKPEDLSRLLETPLARGPDWHTERSGRACEPNKTLWSWLFSPSAGRAPSLPAPWPCRASRAARFGEPPLVLARASSCREWCSNARHRFLELLDFHPATSGNLGGWVFFIKNTIYNTKQPLLQSFVATWLLRR